MQEAQAAAAAAATADANCHPAVAASDPVRADQPALVAFHPVDGTQSVVAADCEAGGEGIGHRRVGTDDGGGDGADRRGSGTRVEQMGAALVGAGGADRSIAGHLDHPDQPTGVPRVGDPDTPGAARIVVWVAEGDDVAAGAHHRRGHAGLSQFVDGPGRGPALDQTGRVDPARQGPGIEPPGRPLPRQGAAEQNFSDLLRGVRQAELAETEPIDRAVRLPDAEDGVGPVEDRPGGRHRQPQPVWWQVGRVDGHGHHRAHDRLGYPDHLIPSWSRADCTDWA